MKNNNLKKLQTDFWEIIQYDTQGKRSAMEDFSDFMYPFTTPDSSLLLSVFDGHVGSRCANFLANTLPSELQKETLQHPTSPPAPVLPSEEIFKRIFKSLDQMWLDSAAAHTASPTMRNQKQETKVLEDGSTALCVALDCSDLIIANCGDCRAILSQGGHTVALTRDHRPTDELEQQRILNQGGSVIGGRLQGSLAVSRAFGNYEFKESQILSCEPEIHHVKLSSDVEYLVVGSDGLYEQFTNEEIISFIKNGLSTHNNNSSASNLETVVKDLVEEALDRGSEDNITILVVKFEKAFKKFLKKRAKKSVSGKSPILLRYDRKSVGKVSPPDSPEPLSKSPCLFKKVHKPNHGKNSPSDALGHTPKKKAETKKLNPCEKVLKLPSPRHVVVGGAGAGGGEKSTYHDRLLGGVKPFKTPCDFFGSRTVPVTISVDKDR